jgi:hypothetical protein
MQSDLLQQLRDIRTPPPPEWWPPAPGWWLVFGLVLLIAGYGVLRVRRERRASLPFRAARALHDQLATDLAAGRITAHAYAHAANELLKRVFVHALGLAAARPMTGDAWLRLLDQASLGQQFTHGPGRALGELRFDPASAIDGAALAARVGELLRELSPRTRARLGAAAP